MGNESESAKVRADVAARCLEQGLKRTRHLSLAEGREFLASGLIPATALGQKTFSASKELAAMPQGSTCMCCGVDLSGKPGRIVEIVTPTKGKTFKTICCADYDTVINGGASEVDDAEMETVVGVPPIVTPPPAPAASVAPAAPTSVQAALATLTAALSAPKAPPVDEKRIVADAVAKAVDAARDEARGFMQKSVEQFLKDGIVADGGGKDEAETPALAKAKGDGVAAAEKATSWTAKATKPAMEAVDKLNKFLSEFSYFRTGVSMRLVNTFARAADKKAALTAYCEVSAMEDLSDLVEKMKSPEFAEVVKAFGALKTPASLNKRFAVFYGAPGGGKTYAAVKAGEAINGGACDVVPCSAGMDAADMLYAYRLDYRTGKRGYVPTALLMAMTAGRAVVLDEVNLLPMEARMFLQNILDNKSKVHIMGVEIPITDGFFVIGTMNIETGLGSTPLPLPLVDRAAVVREFRTTTAQAAVGAGLC